MRRIKAVSFLIGATAAVFAAFCPQVIRAEDLKSADASAEPGAGLPQTSSELFRATKVWTIHLLFAPEEWAAMEPAGGGEGPFGGRPGGGVPGGPGGPGGFGGRAPSGPAMLLAPGFQKHGDENQDGRLSPGEFRALSEKWFAAWDKENTGALTNEQLRSGLNAAFPFPNGPPGAPGPGGRGPGMWLQGKEGKRNGLASAMGIEFSYVHADLEFEGQKFGDVAVRYKGNGTFMESRGSLKRSLKIVLNKNVKGQKLAGATTLNLHNNVTDASWMNEVLSFRLYRDAGVPASRTAYARVFVTVPGKHERKYFGLYSLVENLGKNFADENFRTKKGAFFKPVTPNLFADLGDDWTKYKQTYDPKDDVSFEETQRVIAFCRFVSKADDAEFATRLGEFLEIDEFARYMAVTVWISTLDSILVVGQNYYLYLHPKSGKFQFLPWDLDHSFGQFPMGSSEEQREKLSISHPWRGENRFLDRVFKVEAFRELYFARLEEFSKTLLKPERFQQQVDEIAAAIRPAVREESEVKLARFDKAVAGEPAGSAGFGGGPGGFSAASNPIKAFVKARARSVTEQLAGAEEGLTLENFGLGGPGGPGGRGGPEGPGGGGGPGRRGDFGPGTFLGPAFMTVLDADKDGKVTHAEFTEAFAKWFAAWNSDPDNALTDEELRAGINKDLTPQSGPPRGPPGTSPPPP